MARNFAQRGGMALAITAILSAGCASTGGTGGTAPGPDTSAGADATAGKDTAAGADTDKPKDSSTGTDVQSQAGAIKTISEIQQNPDSVTCADPNKAFVNSLTLKGITISQAVVTSPVWTTKSSAGKETETVYIQTKGGGAWSGVMLTSDKAEGRLTGLKPGDVVTVLGDVKEYYCFTEVEPKITVTVEAATELPVAATVDVDELGAAKAATHEQWEGVLVQVEGIVSDPLADIGKDGKPHAVALGKTDADKTVLVGAGYGIFPQSKDGKANYTKGQKLQVTGFWDFTFGKFKITPLKITVVQ